MSAGASALWKRLGRTLDPRKGLGPQSTPFIFCPSFFFPKRVSDPPARRPVCSSLSTLLPRVNAGQVAGREKSGATGESIGEERTPWLRGYSAVRVPKDVSAALAGGLGPGLCCVKGKKQRECGNRYADIQSGMIPYQTWHRSPRRRPAEKKGSQVQSVGCSVDLDREMQVVEGCCWAGMGPG